jgi:hypothetical protein
VRRRNPFAKALVLSKETRELIRRERRVSDSLHRALPRVAPEVSRKRAHDIAYHLGDFWGICEGHRVRVRRIAKLRGAKDRKKLARLLEDLLYKDLLAHLPYHLRGMKRLLPDFIDSLEGARKLKSKR